MKTTWNGTFTITLDLDKYPNHYSEQELLSLIKDQITEENLQDVGYEMA